MLVKTFQAPTMAEAFKMVKAELGPDAMIISSRKDQSKGFLGFFRKPFFEITAALDVGQRDKEPARDSRPNPYREAPKPERELTAKEEFQNSMLEPLVRELKELRERVEVMAKKDQEPPAAAEPVQAAPVAAKEEPQPIADTDLVKKFIIPNVEDTAPRATPPVQEPPAPRQEKLSLVKPPAFKANEDSTLSVLVHELEEAGVAPEAIEAVTGPVKPAAEKGEKLDNLRGIVRDTIARMVRCAGPLRMKKNVQRIIALVGPTGVGKTTTAAKLAATYALRKDGAKVALITLDNFRVGAIDQLRTYSKIMGVPLEVASTPAELEKAIHEHNDKDLIIIDTAGRSPKDKEKLDELHSFLASYATAEIHLCLAATTRDRELKETVNRFSVLPIRRVIFTKLDESESFGAILNTHLRDKFHLSYFTTGQRVPEDLEVATSRKVAELLVKGGHDGFGH